MSQKSTFRSFNFFALIFVSKYHRRHSTRGWVYSMSQYGVSLSCSDANCSNSEGTTYEKYVGTSPSPQSFVIQFFPVIYFSCFLCFDHLSSFGVISHDMIFFISTISDMKSDFVTLISISWVYRDLLTPKISAFPNLLSNWCVTTLYHFFHNKWKYRAFVMICSVIYKKIIFREYIPRSQSRSHPRIRDRSSLSSRLLDSDSRSIPFAPSMELRPIFASSRHMLSWRDPSLARHRGSMRCPGILSILPSFSLSPWRIGMEYMWSLGSWNMRGYIHDVWDNQDIERRRYARVSPGPSFFECLSLEWIPSHGGYWVLGWCVRDYGPDLRPDQFEWWWVDRVPFLESYRKEGTIWEMILDHDEIPSISEHLESSCFWDSMSVSVAEVECSLNFRHCERPPI